MNLWRMQGTPWTMYGAEWLVETWEPDGNRVREKLAYCMSFACAEAAYKAAVETMPYERITFRHRMRVIKEHIGKWEPNAKRAAATPKDGGSLDQ